MRIKALLLLGILFFAGCASAPAPVAPPRLRAALEAESDGAKRYGRGDYLVAARRFSEAVRLFSSIDNREGAVRNRLHLARAELVQGRAEAARAVLGELGPAGKAFELDALLIDAQALLALGRADDAKQALATAAANCQTGCPQLASLNLLQARTALAGKRPQEALAHAETALKLLLDRDEAAERGNAWRLIAAARLSGGDFNGALPAARKALDIDRGLAVPEKIARDWLLIGDIQQRAFAGGSRMVGSGESTSSYRRALDVANAAGLIEVTNLATAALAETEKAK